MGEGIRSIRIPIESDLQFHRPFSLSFDRLIRRAVYTTGPLVYVRIYVGSVSSDPLQALRILIWLLRVIGQTLLIHPIEYTDTTHQLD